MPLIVNSNFLILSSNENKRKFTQGIIQISVKDKVLFQWNVSQINYALPSKEDLRNTLPPLDRCHCDVASLMLGELEKDANT